MADSIKVTINGEEKEVFLKDDFVAVSSKAEKLERDLEDTRMEVLTPQYEKFLKSLESGDPDPKKEKVVTPPNDDDFKGLTPKQIYEKALSDSQKLIDEKLSNKDKETKAQMDERSKREVASFAASHDDYDKYRPVMYGMSLDPKNSDLNINQLYEKAKEHVKSIQTGSTEEQKRRGSKTSSEKPGGDAQSFAKLKATSTEQISREALDEIKATLGEFPSV